MEFISAMLIVINILYAIMIYIKKRRHNAY